MKPINKHKESFKALDLGKAGEGLVKSMLVTEYIRGYCEGMDRAIEILKRESK